jgi:hypothetical protein
MFSCRSLHSIVRMHAQPIAEDQPPLNLWIPDANHVHLHIRIVVDEEPMPWLTENAVRSRRPSRSEIFEGLVLAVGHHRQDVDDGLGRERAHGGRSNVFNLKCPFA